MTNNWHLLKPDISLVMRQLPYKDGCWKYTMIDQAVSNILRSKIEQIKPQIGKQLFQSSRASVLLIGSVILIQCISFGLIVYWRPHSQVDPLFPMKKTVKPQSKFSCQSYTDISYCSIFNTSSLSHPHHPSISIYKIILTSRSCVWHPVVYKADLPKHEHSSLESNHSVLSNSPN